jgi:hypothetical protein
MFQVIYEYPKPWPDEGPLHVSVEFDSEILIPPHIARRRANGYLSREIALFMAAGEPALVIGERPVWRMPIHLTLRDFGKMAVVGSIDVGASDGTVVPLSAAESQAVRDRALHVAAHCSSHANPSAWSSRDSLGNSLLPTDSV